MNEVQVGTEVKIKNSDLKGRVVEVFHFPTTFKVEFEDGKFEVFKTYEVELLKNEIKEENE
tara:strand:+ start:342 stop:524 length:183 start_codon:yes stop_codon:yes gene_type:complete